MNCVYVVDETAFLTNRFSSQELDEPGGTGINTYSSSMARLGRHPSRSLHQNFADTTTTLSLHPASPPPNSPFHPASTSQVACPQPGQCPTIHPIHAFITRLPSPKKNRPERRTITTVHPGSLGGSNGYSSQPDLSPRSAQSRILTLILALIPYVPCLAWASDIHLHPSVSPAILRNTPTITVGHCIAGRYLAHLIRPSWNLQDHSQETVSRT